MPERLNEGELSWIRTHSNSLKIVRELLSHIDALEEELEGYKLQEQIHINRLKIAEKKGCEING